MLVSLPLYLSPSALFLFLSPLLLFPGQGSQPEIHLVKYFASWVAPAEYKKQWTHFLSLTILSLLLLSLPRKVAAATAQGHKPSTTGCGGERNKWPVINGRCCPVESHSVGTYSRPRLSCRVTRLSCYSYSKLLYRSWTSKWNCHEHIANGSTYHSCAKFGARRPYRRDWNTAVDQLCTHNKRLSGMIRWMIQWCLISLLNLLITIMEDILHAY